MLAKHLQKQVLQTKKKTGLFFTQKSGHVERSYIPSNSRQIQHGRQTADKMSTRFSFVKSDIFEPVRAVNESYKESWPENQD